MRSLLVLRDPTSHTRVLIPLNKVHRSSSPPVHAEVSILRVRRNFLDRFLPSRGILSFAGRRVHGICVLHKGYELALLPSGSHVTDITCQLQRGSLPDDETSWRTKLGTLWKSVKCFLVSILNTIRDRERAAQEDHEEILWRLPLKYSSWFPPLPQVPTQKSKSTACSQPINVLRHSVSGERPYLCKFAIRFIFK